jgi:DNA-binding NarL/FixJ family response regulator
MAIRLLIADDHEVVRQGLREALKDTDIVVVAEATSGDQVVSLVGESAPRVVLLEVVLPREDGLSVLPRLRSEYPDVSVLFFSAHDNPAFVARAVALGAAGYLLKGARLETVVQTIRDVAAGKPVWTRDSLRRVTGNLAAPRPSLDVETPLTHRESEILVRLADGHTNKQIAQALEISYETVKEHVQHILLKIGVSDRTQAAIWAVRKGLV